MRALSVLGERHPQQRPRLRVHRRVAELLGGHLAEAFEAAHLDLALAVEGGAHELVLMRVVARIDGRLALMEAVERRGCQEQAAVLDELRHLAEEEGHEQRGDMRAVDIGVRHDDDALVTQLLLAVALARPAAERLDEVGDLLVLAELVGGGRRDVEDLAAQGEDRLRVAVARLLRRAAGAVALDEEDLGADGARLAAIRELAGQAQLARRALAVELLLLAAALTLLGALDHGVEKRVARFRIAREPMVEMILERALDEPRGLGRGELLLGLSLELRLADEEREQDHRALRHILGGDLLRAAIIGELAIGLEAARQRGAQARLMRPALGGRHGVAVEGGEALLILGPGDRPFDAAALLKLLLAEEGAGGEGGAGLQGRREIVGEAAGEMKPLLLWDALGQRQLRVAPPADLDAAEEIGLGAGEAVERRRLEMRVGAEDLRVRVEADRGAAPVLDGALILELRRRLAAAVLLRPELP